jgi:hypothetical protein
MNISIMKGDEHLSHGKIDLPNVLPQKRDLILLEGLGYFVVKQIIWIFPTTLVVIKVKEKKSWKFWMFW